jgi:hypothetical protein
MQLSVQVPGDETMRFDDFFSKESRLSRYADPAVHYSDRRA